MKKLIALIFAMLLVSVGVAGASDVTLSGDYFVRGTYNDNVQQVPDDVSDNFSNYDQEIHIMANWKIDDSSSFFIRFNIRDDNWATSDEPTEEGAITSPQLDDNIIAEQWWGAHKFGNGHTLSVGKIPSGAWATSFGNNESEAYRLKYVAPTEIGTIFAIVQKNAERGSATVGEDVDSDTYYLAMITKIGNINVKPLLAYTVSDNIAPAAESKGYAMHLGFDGTFDAVGFESEIIASKTVLDVTGADDPFVWGAYLNVWMTAGPAKFGILGAYGSFDDDTNTAFDFGDDFEAGGALIMGDDITFYGSGNDLSAGSLIAVYVDYAINEQLSVGAYLGYAKCNVDDGGAYDGATVSEISADVTYAITPNVTYKVAAGVANMDYNTGFGDADNSIEVMNKLSFAF